jgi:hypothetical protein
MYRIQSRKCQQQSQEWWHLSWLPGHLGNRMGITHVTWWSPSYFLLIDALKVSFWAFWIRFNCWRIWLPVSRTNCKNNKNRSVQLLKKQVLGTIYDELSFKHYHLHSTTRKKYTILAYNLSVLHSVLSSLHCHHDPLLRHDSHQFK